MTAPGSQGAVQGCSEPAAARRGWVCSGLCLDGNAVPSCSAKLITFMDYRLKGSISLTVTLCNAISLTTHLILGCNSPPRTIMNKWSAGTQSRRKSAEPQRRSAIWPRETREPAWGHWLSGADKGSARSMGNGVQGMGLCQNGEGGCQQHPAVLVGWDFGLQQDHVRCQTKGKGAV